MFVVMLLTCQWSVCDVMYALNCLFKLACLPVLIPVPCLRNLIIFMSLTLYFERLSRLLLFFTRFGIILTFISGHVPVGHPTWLSLMGKSYYEETVILIILFG